MLRVELLGDRILIQRLLRLSGKSECVSEIGVDIGGVDAARDRFLVATNRFRPTLMIVSDVPEGDGGLAGRHSRHVWCGVAHWTRLRRRSGANLGSRTL